MNLKAAKVIGFFSMPSQSLAEHNPSAYESAMRALPPGCGTCHHCGTGIIHHVIIESEGKRAFIGTTCAEKVGGELARCVSARATPEQLEDRRIKREQKLAEYHANQKRTADESKKFLARRYRRLKAEINILEKCGEFSQSLGRQLRSGGLSDRQAYYAVKIITGWSRCTPKREKEWNKLERRLMYDEREKVTA